MVGSKERLFYGLLFLIIFLASVVKLVSGAEIVGPTEVDASQPAWFTLAGLGEKDQAAFFPSDELYVNPQHVVKNSALFWAKKAGTYSINAMVVTINPETGFVTGLIPMTHKITVGNGPEPEPDPDPQPDPTPMPVKGRVAIIIRETGVLSVEVGNVLTALRGNPKIAQWGELWILDQDLKGQDGTAHQVFAPYRNFLKEKQISLPGLIVTNTKGHIVRYGGLSLDVDKVIKHITGK